MSIANNIHDGTFWPHQRPESIAPGYIASSVIGDHDNQCSESEQPAVALCVRF
jgi:hypothetical protein